MTRRIFRNLFHRFGGEKEPWMRQFSFVGTSFRISLNDGTNLEFRPYGSCVNVYNPYQNFFPVVLF